MVIDYFIWEAAEWSGSAKGERLQEEAMEKYEGIFWHYTVYEPLIKYE